jgi:hypothetical protein
MLCADSISMVAPKARFHGQWNPTSQACGREL